MSVEQLRQDTAVDVVDALERTRKALNATMAMVCDEAGVTLGHFNLLTLLSAFPNGISLSELGRLQGTSRQYVHAVIRACSRAGWTTHERVGQPVLTRLTPGGEALVKELRAKMAGRFAAAVNGMTVQDLQQLLHLLNQVSGSCRAES